MPTSQWWTSTTPPDAAGRTAAASSCACMAEHLPGFARAPLPAEPPRVRPGVREKADPLLAAQVEGQLYLVRDVLDGQRIAVDRRVAADFRHRRGAGNHGGTAAGHGFERGKPEAFIQAREDQGLSVGVVTAQQLFGDKPGEVNAPFQDARRFKDGRVARKEALLSPHDHQVDLALGLYLAKGADEGLDVLVRLHVPDAKDIGARGGAFAARFLEPALVDPVVDDVNLAGVRACQPDHLVSREARDADDGARLAGDRGKHEPGVELLAQGGEEPGQRQVGEVVNGGDQRAAVENRDIVMRRTPDGAGGNAQSAKGELFGDRIDSRRKIVIRLSL